MVAFIRTTLNFHIACFRNLIKDQPLKLTFCSQPKSKFCTTIIEHFAYWSFPLGLFKKLSTLDPKKFCTVSFQKLVFFVSLYPEFLKKTKKWKNVDFWSILAVTPKTKSQTLKFFFEKDKKPLIDRFHHL